MTVRCQLLVQDNIDSTIKPPNNTSATRSATPACTTATPTRNTNRHHTGPELAAGQWRSAFSPCNRPTISKNGSRARLQRPASG